VPLNVTLSEAKGLGVVGFIRVTPILTPRFFVTSLLRMTFDTKLLGGEGDRKKEKGALPPSLEHFPIY
jgi:hypothetical protein